MNEIVQITNLKFGYNDHTPVLKDISLSVFEGEVFALLGHNGAGKTTLIRILLDFIRNYTGKVALFGSSADVSTARGRIGYMAEHPTAYVYDNATEYLQYFASIADMQGCIEDKIDELLNLTGLSVHRGKLLGEYSKGMLQRLNLARALLNEPDLLIMDEPIIGLDPIGQKLIEKVVFDRKSKGKAVLVNTHAVDFAERVADRVAFLMGGELKAIIKREEFEIQDFPMCIALKGDGDKIKVIIEKGFEVKDKDDKSIIVRVDTQEKYFRLLREADILQLIISNIFSDKISLSHKFLEYAGELTKEDFIR